MESKERKYTTISISHETKRELEEVGKMSQTHDDLLKELIGIKKAMLQKAISAPPAVPSNLQKPKKV